MIITGIPARNERKLRTRTRGDAELYRVTLTYRTWPLNHYLTSKHPYAHRSPRANGKPYRVTYTYRTVEPVNYWLDPHRDYYGVTVVAEQLTANGWEPYNWKREAASA